jgi:hypothetical protein
MCKLRLPNPRSLSTSSGSATPDRLGQTEDRPFDSAALRSGQETDDREKNLAAGALRKLRIINLIR